MKNTQYYIDLLRAKTETRSDYAVAKLIGVSRQAMTYYKRGTANMDSDVALRAGAILDIDPLEIIANVKASKAPDRKTARQWLALGKKIAGRAASLVLMLPVIAASALYSIDSKAVSVSGDALCKASLFIHYAHKVLMGLARHTGWIWALFAFYSRSTIRRAQ